ncbi:Cysteine-rich receptor-like protein kinase 2 [Capsicum baccatum]|uniref:Cysteine-rich receptor-like protein kinase 2 n=1 Tax=Capsicum baccatum TaxID=33114 RepID=A0A2G2VQN3_CAPBA|nr:Cysteine-rich receptor-like protein kinase 2 [Capsicum baccatum]
MLDSMKYQVYKRKSMYRCGGFPLAFQCWFYECCPYANDKLVVRVGDSVPRVLYWSVMIRPNYRKVKFTFSDRNCEQVVLTNIEPTCIEKSIFQLPVFKPVPQKEHVAFKKYDGDHIDVVARDHLSDNVVDEIGKETVGVGDCIDTNAEEVKNSFEDSWSDFPDYEVSKFTQPISQENVQYMKYLVENSQEIDWSVVSDSEISKYTQPDKIGEHSVIEKAVGKIDTDFGSTSVVLVATEVLIGVGSIRKNVDDTFVGDKSTVILDDTPVVPRRIRNQLQYVNHHTFLLSSFNSLVYSKSVNNLANAFDFGVVMVKTKEWFYTLGYAGVLLTDSFLGKRKDVAVIKEDSEIVEYILRYVIRCNVSWYFVDNVLFSINIFENFHWILARLSFKDQSICVYDSMRSARYRRVAEKAVSAYSELIPNLFSSIDFWDKKIDGIAAADSFDIRMVDGLPTQKNTSSSKMEIPSSSILCSLFVIILVLLLPNTSVAKPRSQTVKITCGTQLELNMMTSVPNFIGVMETISQQMRTRGYGVAVTGTGPDSNYRLAQFYGDLSLLDCSLYCAEARMILPQCFLYNGGRIYLDGCFMRKENYTFYDQDLGLEDKHVCGNRITKSTLFPQKLGELFSKQLQMH